MNRFFCHSNVRSKINRSKNQILDCFYPLCYFLILREKYFFILFFSSQSDVVLPFPFVCPTSRLVTPFLLVSYQTFSLQVRPSCMKSIHKVTTCFAGTIIRVNRGPQTECSVLGAKRMSTFRLPKRKSFPDCSPRL